MSKPALQSLIGHLGEVPDPRMARTPRHELMDIPAIALCAVIGGADHWTEVVEFGQAKQKWFAGFLKLPNGIPSHDLKFTFDLDGQPEQVCCNQGGGHPISR